MFVAVKVKKLTVLINYKGTAPVYFVFLFLLNALTSELRRHQAAGESRTPGLRETGGERSDFCRASSPNMEFGVMLR